MDEILDGYTGHDIPPDCAETIFLPLFVTVTLPLPKARKTDKGHAPKVVPQTPPHSDKQAGPRQRGEVDTG